MHRIVLLLFFIFPIGINTYSSIRTNNLPEGFKWRYIMDEREPTPRSGQFWRTGIIMENKLIVLNTYMLIALDFSGKELWKMGLPAENPYAEAKIHQSSSNEIIIVITDALLRINTDTGELIDHYGYDVRRRAAFQFTELLPRQSILYKDYVYVFLGPQLLSFHKESLVRKKVHDFDSSPKTIPIVYQDQFVIGFNNGFLVLFNPNRKKSSPLIYGSPSKEFSLRQPIVQDDLLYIPMNDRIEVYQGKELYSRSTLLTDSILSSVNNQVWLRKHQSAMLQQIDATLSPLKEIQFISPKLANKISSPLIGNSNKLIHIDGIDGQLFIINNEENNLTLKTNLYTEDFMDNPPIQFLDQTEELLLIGGFDGLYLIDLQKI